MGLSCQKPLSRAFEQDATLVKQWIEWDFPRSAPWRKGSVLSCVFADESGVRSDFHAGTTWGIRGKTHVVRHTGKRLSSQYAVCDLGQRRTRVHDLAEVALSGAVHRVPAPVDHKLSEKDLSPSSSGLPAHKAKSVHRFVHQVKDCLRLFFLPPYSPEINLDELVWKRRQEPWRCSNIDPRPQRFASRSEFKVATAAKKSRQSSRCSSQMETTKRYAAA